MDDDGEKLIFHANIACPLCERKVHVVVDGTACIARWCCVSCHVTGVAPCIIESSPDEARITAVGQSA